MHESFLALHTRNVDAAHLLARVHSFETLGTVDGPGTRFVVFMQGCLFRCKYCHNRDTWDLDSGELYSVIDVLTEILAYIPFMDASNGGVTVSGGEPLLQREFVRVLFKLLHQQGVHTCLDTNGYVTKSKYDEEMEKLLSCTDLILLDIKHIDDKKHIDLTKATNEYTLKFAKYLQQKKQPVWIRHVVVPGYTDDFDDIRKLAEFIAPLDNVEKVELLPYHKLGEHKWTAYDEKYSLHGVEPPSNEKMLQIQALFNEQGVEAIV